jgi:DNA-binding transcriptional regulator YdaS (Cro superfamily)
MTLKAWIKENGVKPLANATGLSEGYLYQIASGVRRASRDVSLLIQGATKGEVTVNDLRPDWAAIFNDQTAINTGD